MKYFKISILVFIVGFILWCAGFGLFAYQATSTQVYSPEEPSSAIVVLTGGDGRIDAGLDLFAARRGLYLYITSVHPGVTEDHIRDKWHGQTALPVCCIALDYSAEDTIGNAKATRQWISSIKEATGQDISTIRLVTSNYHMPRALQDFHYFLPDITLYPHPVTSPGVSLEDPLFWKILIREYHKYIFRMIQTIAPLSWQGL